MRAYAVIPPILLDEKKRRFRYVNRNGLIDELVNEYKDHKNINIWTEQEKEIFREKYLQHPKNYVVIASYLERKSVNDCIQYYYSTKKKENYKMLVKRRIRRPRKPNNQPVVEVLGMNSTGVTTRGSVAASLRTTQQPNNNSRHISMTGEQEEPTNYSVDNSAGSVASTPSLSVTANDTPPVTSPGPITAMNLEMPSSIGVTTIGSETSSNTTTNTMPTISSKEVQEKDKENLSLR